jgi:sec-independent protein translocase protein TatA
MLNNLTGWHFLIILVVVLLLFGAPKLPGLARSLGQSMKIFKNEIKSDTIEGEKAVSTGSTTTTGSTTATTDETSKAAGPADHTTKS